MTNKSINNKPESGKIYVLTGGAGVPCILNGNTWKESEIKPNKNLNSIHAQQDGREGVECDMPRKLFSY